MSTQNTQSYNNNHTLASSQNRADYADKMNSSKPREIQYTKIKGRWNNLYLDSKIQRMKQDEYTREQLKQREENMFRQCTFSPKLNTKSRYNKNNYLQSNNKAITTNNNTNDDRWENLDINMRQTKWIKKKELKIEELKQTKNNKELQECIFVPEVNSANKLIANQKFKTEAEKIVEDPESFSIFVSRLSKKRKDNEIQQENLKKRPGSGNIWNSKKQNYNLDYDYTKHEYSSRGFGTCNTCNSVKNFNRNHTPNKTSLKNHKSASKMQFDKNKYYDYLYSLNRQNENEKLCSVKTTLPNNTKNTLCGIDEAFLKLNRPIEYGKALEILHEELFSFRLMPEDE